MTHAKGHENLVLTKEESALVDRLATLYDLSREEAVALVVKRELEKRVRTNTGKGPARVYDIRRKA